MLAGPGFDAAIDAVQKVDGFINMMMEGARKALSLWVGAVSSTCDLLLPALSSQSGYAYLLGPNFVDQLKQLNINLADAHRVIDCEPSNMCPPGTDIVEALQAATTCWNQLAMQLKALGEAPDRVLMETLRSSVKTLLEQLVPARIHVEFKMAANITRCIGDVFIPGIEKNAAVPRSWNSWRRSTRI